MRKSFEAGNNPTPWPIFRLVGFSDIFELLNMEEKEYKFVQEKIMKGREMDAEISDTRLLFIRD